MKTKVTAELENWKGREVKLRGKKAVGKSVFEIGLIIEGQAKQLTPIKTGRLRGSITTQVVGKGTAPESPATATDVIDKPTEQGVAHIGTNVEYGPYVEFGSVRSAAQPFLRPALELAKGNALTIVKKNSRSAFKEYLE